MRAASVLILGIVFLLLLGPVLIITAAGFSAGEMLAFPPEGLSFRWYVHVLENEDLRDSFLLSFGLASAAAVIALLVGIPAAYALVRFDLVGARLISSLVTTPILVPAIIIGLALLHNPIAIGGTALPGPLLLAHAVLVLPYAVRVLVASLANVPPELEEAAILLGVSRIRAFMLIVIPNLRAGLAATFFLCFVESFNQLPVSLFLVTPGQTTLPIQMMLLAEVIFDPSIAALSALSAALAVILVLVAERILGLSRYV